MILIFIAISFFGVAKGQNTLVASSMDKNARLVAYYDSLTFAQYQNRDYKSLISTAKKVEKLGVNFQYLNYRKAIAYYELKNYVSAAKYYEKALSDVPEDLYLKESLYLAYMFSGQREKADIFVKTLPKASRDFLGFKPSVVNFVRVSGGYTFSDNNENLRNDITNLDTINQYQDMMLGGVVLGLNISDRVKLNAGYNLFNTKFERFAQNSVQHKDLLSQHQLNLGLEYFSANNFSFGFTGGFYAIEKSNKSDAQTLNNGQEHKRKWSIASSQSTYYNLSAMVFLSKRFTYVLPEISVAYSDFAFSNQLQAKLQLTYYPFGNLNFYGITSAAIIFDNHENRDNQTVFTQNLGAKLFRNVWLDGMVSVGNHLNYITDRSFVVYDTYDPIMLISSMSLSYYFKRMALAATYSFTQREGWALTDSYTQFIKYKYNNQLVNLAIRWKF